MKRIKKLIKKLNNRGSSIIMVIVSISFVAIIVGALLTAASYAYKLKIANKNAKDNFYYVEQAMQEIYAGVGSKTVDQMYNAYTSTIENMVTYDLAKQTYVTLSNDEANKMFKKSFMTAIQNEDYFKQDDAALANSLANFITNDTVKIDANALHKVTEYEADGVTIKRIIIKDIKLSRTAEYNNNSANGVYTQTITADLEISQPDFNVNFDTTTADYSNIFDFAMVADMGIEINQPQQQQVLKITGNIYGAADYYNKSYNNEASDAITFTNEAGKSDKSTSRVFSYKYDENEPAIKYNHVAVSSKVNTSKTDTKITGLKNKYAKDATNNALFFDGENANSMYSGLYITNSKVSILAETVIVPGTIAIMNNADVSVAYKDNGRVVSSQVWTDNVVVGGYGEKVAKDSTQTSYIAPKAQFNADLYVRDDTELNAERGSLTIAGAYYGYGNSTEKDTRVFVPTVNTENFQVRVAQTDANGNVLTDSNGNTLYTYVNRSHYNSSAIVINGQNTTLDLSKTSALYLAGRAYIELSKDVTYNAEDGVADKDSNGNVIQKDKDDEVYLTSDGTLTDNKKTDGKDNTSVVTETYSFNPGVKNANGTIARDTNGNIITYISDYKTGESLSVKSNQVAYIPIILNGMPGDHEFVTNTTAKNTYVAVKLHPDVANVAFFGDFFPEIVFDSFVPVTSQSINNRTFYYYDLESAYDIIKDNNQKTAAAAVIAKYGTVDLYTAAFIEEYTKEAIKESSDAYKADDTNVQLPLNDILANEDFTMGNIVFSGKVDDNSTTNAINGAVYSSGAITTKKNTAFNMVTKNGESDITALLTSAGLTTAQQTALGNNAAAKALAFSSQLSKDYLYIKWNLGEFDTAQVNEKAYVDKLIENGWTEDMITPINRYLLFENIDSNKDITPNNFTLASGYKVWITDEDVVIGQNSKDYVTATDGTATTIVKGIVITEGDVSFASAVTKFEGLIVSGGKIYINGGSLESMIASPEICRSILRECMVTNDATCKYIRNVFAEYRISEDGKCPVCGKTLEAGTKDDGTPDYSIAVCPDESCKYNNTINSNQLLVDVDKIDYTDVCTMDNWNKTVE